MDNDIDPTKPMSNEVIVYHLADIKKDVQAVLVQTSKTNGRVTSLEKWKAYTAGAMAVVMVILLPILMILVSMYLNKKPLP